MYSGPKVPWHIKFGVGYNTSQILRGCQIARRGCQKTERSLKKSGEIGERYPCSHPCSNTHAIIRNRARPHGFYEHLHILRFPRRPRRYRELRRGQRTLVTVMPHTAKPTRTANSGGSSLVAPFGKSGWVGYTLLWLVMTIFAWAVPLLMQVLIYMFKSF